MSRTALMMTEQQRRIWVLIAAGCRAREVARAIGLGARMGAYQTAKLYRALDLDCHGDGKSCIARATRLAVKHGLIVLASPEIIREPTRTYYIGKTP